MAKEGSYIKGQDDYGLFLASTDTNCPDTCSSNCAWPKCSTGLRRFQSLGARDRAERELRSLGHRIIAEEN